MEILIGRVTADAKVTALKDERKVVNFSIAINDSYKTKGTEQVKKLVTYVNCSYWIGEGIAQYLTKGTIVELCGRISVSAYTAMDGGAKASLNFHVNNIKLHGGTSKKEDAAEEAESTSPTNQTGKHNRKKATAASAENITEPVDDLPF